MISSRSQVVRTAVVAACAGAAWWSIHLAAAEPEKVRAAISEQVKAEEAAVASQKKVETLDNEASKAVTDYRQMLAEAQSLKAYNDQMAEQVASQQQQVQELTQQLNEIQTTSREVLPLMTRCWSR
jgi:predicted RNase H-like nuclease (RuvC/YqgF family)